MTSMHQRNGFLNIRAILGCFLILCLLASLGVVLLRHPGGSQVLASPATIYVPDDYSTIQAAVEGASDGDTIIIRDGTYAENVDVNKQLTIRAENGADSTTVQAANSDDHVFEVMADYVNIEGFTVIGATGSDKAGIYLASHTDHCTISNNRCGYDSDHRNPNGIYLDNSSNNTILNNTANANGLGIYLYRSSHNDILNNITLKNYYGIYLRESSNNTIFNNTSRNNAFGIYIYYGSNSNTIYLNNSINNEDNVRSDSTNTWHSPTEICYAYGGTTYKSHLGNHWGDYTGADGNNDGIGDTAYAIGSADNNDNDDSHPLLMTSYYYTLQAWYLYSDDKMYKGDPTKAPSTVTMPGGGSSIWIADSAALVDIDFAADTDKIWNGQITFTSPPAGGDSFTVELGYSTDGSDFTSGGPQATFIGDGGQEVFIFEASVAGFEVSQGKYLALKITNNSTSSYDVQVGGAWSYISSPETDPGYPGVENQPPNQPNNTLPADEATSVSLTPTLTSSDFSDPDNDSHLASQWQISTTSGAYSSPVFDSGEDSSNLTQIAIPSETLDYATTYYWRLRHKDNHGAWSEYSEETSFTIISGPTTTLTIDPSSFDIESGKSTTLTAILRDSAGNPLPGKIISWSADSGTVSPSSQTTDSQGQVTTTYTAPSVSTQTSVTITVVFDGDASYQGSSAVFSGTVTLPSVSPPEEQGDGGITQPSAGFPVGIVAGAVGGVAVIIGVILFFQRRRRVLAEVIARYERRLKEWEAEGFDTSEFRKKYGKYFKPKK